jgi:hypothetical protein
MTVSVVHKLLSATVAKLRIHWRAPGRVVKWIKNRSLLDNILSIWLFLEKCYVYNTALYNLFFNFKHTYENVCRGKLFQMYM